MTGFLKIKLYDEDSMRDIFIQYIEMEYYLQYIEMEYYLQYIEMEYYL